MRHFLGVFTSFIVFLSLPGQAFGQTSTRAIGEDLTLAASAGPLLNEAGSRPLQLEALSAGYENGAMVLEWITASERNNARYEVERSVRTHDEAHGRR